MIDYKKLARPVLVLLVSAVFLLVTSYALASLEKKNRIEEEGFTLSYLLMDSSSFSEQAYDGEDENISRVFKGETGYVVETIVPGYVEDIVLWIGVKNEGYVTGITIRDMDETLALGRNALQDVDFLMQFLRSEGSETVGETVDSITGATVTSKAIAKAVNSAVAFVTGADITSSATEWGV